MLLPFQSIFFVHSSDSSVPVQGEDFDDLDEDLAKSFFISKC